MAIIIDEIMKGKKIIITIGIILCVCCVCFTSRTALIFVGNSYENSKEINVTISVDDKVLYNGFLKAYEIPMLLEKKKMRVGFYKVSAKCNNIQVQHRFFYFFFFTIWIDFDFATNDILLVSKFYKQIPL